VKKKRRTLIQEKGYNKSTCDVMYERVNEWYRDRAFCQERSKIKSTCGENDRVSVRKEKGQKKNLSESTERKVNRVKSLGSQWIMKGKSAWMCIRIKVKRASLTNSEIWIQKRWVGGIHFVSEVWHCWYLIHYQKGKLE